MNRRSGCEYSDAQQGWWRVKTFRRFTVMWFAALLVLPVWANAQGLTGTLVGSVKDANGGAIPGATVRVASAALIGGERQTATSDRGQWRFPVLPPGAYTLTVDAAPRFAAHREDAIAI